jgi:hypothetical protein
VLQSFAANLIAVSLTMGGTGGGKAFLNNWLHLASPGEPKVSGEYG